MSQGKFLHGKVSSGFSHEDSLVIFSTKAISCAIEGSPSPLFARNSHIPVWCKLTIVIYRQREGQDGHFFGPVYFGDGWCGIR